MLDTFQYLLLKFTEPLHLYHLILTRRFQQKITIITRVCSNFYNRSENNKINRVYKFHTTLSLISFTFHSNIKLWNQSVHIQFFIMYITISGSYYKKKFYGKIYISDIFVCEDIHFKKASISFDLPFSYIFFSNIYIYFITINCSC